MASRMMRRLLLTLPIAGGALLLLLLGGSDNGDERLFHVRLADPDQYTNGVYTESFQADRGEYLVRFVPNGDSPRLLSIKIGGQDVSFHGEYVLQSTLHDTGISEYYTWEYMGPERVAVSDAQSLTVTVDPHGSVAGPVSVSLILDQPP